MQPRKKTSYILLSVLLVLGVFISGVYVGYINRPYTDRVVNIENKERGEEYGDFEPFWKVWNLIDEKYPNASNISVEERIEGAMKGLVSSLGDEYSVFFSREEAEDFESSIKGSFEGVGMEVGIKDDILTVIAPVKDTPAERAGMQPGDRILKIGDMVTNNITVDKAVQLIRGPKGTDITLTVYRDGVNNPFEITITRGTIEIPTLTTNLRDDGVFVIELYNFGATSAPKFEQALWEFKQSRSDKLIIDLRSNPGGYLDAAVHIASFFLPEGEPIVVEDFGEKEEIYRSKGYSLLEDYQFKTAVLINQGSASASEILAGALKEHDVAKVIGTQSYGKGSVQELLKIADGTRLKLTIARWLTPNRISISEEGLAPDIVVEEDVVDRAVTYLKTGK